MLGHDGSTLGRGLRAGGGVGAVGGGGGVGGGSRGNPHFVAERAKVECRLTPTWKPALERALVSDCAVMGYG